jgi:membrane associated rhomboid family serine protease
MERLVVLKMAGIPGAIVQTGSDFAVRVESLHLDSAIKELTRYELENRRRVPESPTFPKVSNGWVGAIIFAAVLVLVHVLQQQHAFALDWWAAGMAKAGLIRQGEWWRIITALSLHAGVLHLAGNVALGGLFGVLASQRFGYGLAWCGILLAGALGNAINAVVQAATHASVGASTAVFGALGILAAHTWRTEASRRERAIHRWAPMVSGVLLLSFLGMAGERTDVVAHVAGFGSGALLGALFGSVKREWLVRSRLQLALGATVLGVLTLAWILALAPV